MMPYHLWYSILDKQIDDIKPPARDFGLLEQCTEEKTKLQKRIDNLIDMRADGDISKESYQKKIAEINERISVIEKEL